MTFTTTFRTLSFASLALLGTAAMAQQGVLPAQSSIEFTAKQLGVPLKGHFKQFEAQLQFDVAKPETSKIVFTVDTGSATMGSKETDSNLLSADWFNVGQFPKATFDSTAVKALGDGKYQIDGTLTIKGQSQPVSVPVTLTQSGDITTATGHAYTRSAMFRRNHCLVDNADLLLAAYDGQPGGTAMTCELARRYDVPVMKIKPNVN